MDEEEYNILTETWRERTENIHKSNFQGQIKTNQIMSDDWIVSFNYGWAIVKSINQFLTRLHKCNDFYLSTSPTQGNWRETEVEEIVKLLLQIVIMAATFFWSKINFMEQRLVYWGSLLKLLITAPADGLQANLWNNILISIFSALNWSEILYTDYTSISWFNSGMPPWYHSTLFTPAYNCDQHRYCKRGVPWGFCEQCAGSGDRQQPPTPGERRCWCPAQSSNLDPGSSQTPLCLWHCRERQKSYTFVQSFECDTNAIR